MDQGGVGAAARDQILSGNFERLFPLAMSV
jgi:hypothetical protein